MMQVVCVCVCVSESVIDILRGMMQVCVCVCGLDCQVYPS
jgi:hypothetical protein